MNLQQLRDEIDLIDDTIEVALKQRMEIVKQMAPLKQQIYDSQREQEILTKHNEFREIFISILEHSKRLQVNP